MLSRGYGIGLSRPPKHRESKNTVYIPFCWNQRLYSGKLA
uniref:Uncharacterized protein n=1 Tax=Arundo donax TaxID=35708 RepID=A0A0A9CCS5_ARUDO